MTVNEILLQFQRLPIKIYVWSAAYGIGLQALLYAVPKFSELIGFCRRLLTVGRESKAHMQRYRPIDTIYRLQLPRVAVMVRKQTKSAHHFCWGDLQLDPPHRIEVVTLVSRFIWSQPL